MCVCVCVIERERERERERDREREREGDLFLGINHERPPPTSCDQHSIFSGDRVSRQAILIPLSYLIGVSQSVSDCDVTRYGDAQVTALL